ncbi:MAG: glycosyltransferase [Rhodothermales bacterium]|nr:glycosyltransferase [Rhodothermales bacterium]
MRKKRVLFIYLSPASFVRDDLEMLGRRVDLVPFHFDVDRARSAAGLLGLWREQRRWLGRELPGADLVMGWFADYHMVLPVAQARRRGIPVAVALGGYDCLRLPELAYGVFASRWRAPLARYVLRNASLLLPVAEALLCSENQFSAWPERRRYGLCADAPGVHTPHRVLPTGYVPERWPAGPECRAPSVCTVGLIDTEQTFRRKGIDLVLEAAALLPDVPFRVVGVTPTMRAWIAGRFAVPPNLTFDGQVPREALVLIYQEASVYLQLSRAEGMPNVLCEAMLCGCIPVASRVFGNPAGVGDAGFLVDEPTPEAIVPAIRQALAAEAGRREQARRHIETHFQRHHREAAMMDAFAQLTGEA